MRHALVVFQMVHGAVVSFAESIAEIAPGAFIDGRMLVDVVIVSIGMAMVGEVAACGFNALMKTTALSIAVFVGCLVPAVIVILVRRSTGERLRFISLGLDRAG